MRLYDLCLSQAVTSILARERRVLEALEDLPDMYKRDIFSVLTNRGSFDLDTCRLLVCEAITEVRLDGTFATSAILDLIAHRCPLLSSFSFTVRDPHARRAHCTESSLINLLTICGSTLTCVHLRHSRIASDRTLAAIVENCPLIDTLDISGNMGISSAALSRVWELEDLTTLNVSLTQADDSLFEALQHVRHEVKLRELHIAYCPSITDEGIELLLPKCTRLVTLSMRGSTSITHQARETLHETWVERHQQPTILSWSIPA